MAMSSGGGGGINSTPNVTPLIDVMLVLLIIFMIVTPLINSGFQAQPPQGINLKSEPEDDADIVLGIDRDGRYYLQKKPIENSTLLQQLQGIYSTRTTNKVLYVKADRNLKYQKVLDAMTIAAKAGARVVGAISDQRPGTISSIPSDNPQLQKKKP
ncbi:MAG TPA: biopolymer transporter ExbD [Gemmatimonadaceae bacterium]|nr:biopolymer transporter ExbD [Gemmatimonadaceae bacterium]